MPCAAAGAFVPSVFANQKSTPLIGACDWSIGQRQNIAAFNVAREIGLRGIQVSFSDPGPPFDLRERTVRESYYKRVEETGIQIASLGMGILNKRPLATDPEAIKWVDQAIDTMAAMKKEQPDKAPDICLLAFFGKGDINGKPELMDAVTSKLKTISNKAEDHGIIFGIESYLSADDHLKIIDGVGSPAIQVYYDSANSHRMGYNIYKEVVQIGGKRLCQIHCKERSTLLGNGEIDFARFKQALDTANYDGWLIIEGAIPQGTPVIAAYQHNLALLERVCGSP